MKMPNSDEILRRLATAMESLVIQLHSESSAKEEEKRIQRFDQLKDRLVELERAEKATSPSINFEKGKITIAGLPFGTLFKIFKWIWPVFIGTGSHFIVRWLHSLH